MIRQMTRILVVPVLGGLLAPTKLPGTALAPARPRSTKSRRRVGEQRVRDPNRINAKRNRRRPRALFSIGAVGVALVVAGCGSASGNSAGSAAAGAHTTPVAPASAVTTPAAAPAKAPATPKPTTTPTAPANAPAAATTQTPATTPKAPAASTTKSPNAGIPQNNGGDADPDNNGGPSDGDGAI
jgi:pilus assembly protein FimV